MPTLKNPELEKLEQKRKPDRTWEQIGTIYELFEVYRKHGKIRDDGIDELMYYFAEIIMFDITRYRIRPCNDFLAGLLDTPVSSMSPAQVRGMLNVICGSVRANRRRFYKSRGNRIDTDKGYENCIICGGPLNDLEAAHRGAGLECYKNIIRMRMSW